MNLQDAAVAYAKARGELIEAKTDRQRLSREAGKAHEREVAAELALDRARDALTEAATEDAQ